MPSGGSGGRVRRLWINPSFFPGKAGDKCAVGRGVGVRLDGTRLLQPGKPDCDGLETFSNIKERPGESKKILGMIFRINMVHCTERVF